MGGLCALLTLSIGYVLASTMQLMLDRARPNSFRIHKSNTTRFGGTGLFIAFIVVVMGALEVRHTDTSDGHVSVFIDTFAGMHLYIAAAAMLISGLLRDVSRESHIALTIALQMVGATYLLLAVVFQNEVNEVSSAAAISYLLLLLFATNSINILDGINGGAGFVSLVALLSVGYVGFQLESSFIVFASSLMIGVIITFLCFNYPYGKVFLGDSGSFLLGFVIGALFVLGINYCDMNPLYVANLLIYPSCEIAVSLVTRGLRLGSLPPSRMFAHLFEPDNYHLHYFLYARFGNRAGLIVGFIYSFFVAVASMCHTNNFALIVNLIMFSAVYAALFAFFKTKGKYLYTQA